MNGTANGSRQAFDNAASINQLLKSVETMRTDLHQVHLRINLLERSLADLRNQHLRKKVNINIEMNVSSFNTKTYI